MPRVSIIILNYNGVADTLHCLKSLENVNYPHFEIIVLDNGSTGKDVEILRKYEMKNYRFMDNKKNLGFAGGCNRGIEWVLKQEKSDYVYLLNNDTEVDKEFLAEAVEVIEKDEKIGIIASKSLYFDKRDRIESAGLSLLNCGDMISRGKGNPGGNFNKNEELLGACGAAMLLRCKMLKEIGLFDEDYFLYSEDSDLSLRAVCRGWKCFFAHKSVIYHKVSAATSKSRSYDMNVKAQYNIFRAYFTNAPLLVILLNSPFILMYWLFVPLFSVLFLRGRIAKVFCCAQIFFLKNLRETLRKRRAVMKGKKGKNLHFFAMERNFFPVYLGYFREVVLKGGKSILE